MTKTQLNAKIREDYIDLITRMLNRGLIDTDDCFETEDICLIASNKIALPVVDAEGNEKWVTLTVSVPTDDEFDGYTERDFYAAKVKADKEKAEEKARLKAEKIARDKAAREKKAREKAEKEALIAKENAQ